MQPLARNTEPMRAAGVARPEREMSPLEKYTGFLTAGQTEPLKVSSPAGLELMRTFVHGEWDYGKWLILPESDSNSGTVSESPGIRKAC